MELRFKRGKIDFGRTLTNDQTGMHVKLVRHRDLKIGDEVADPASSPPRFHKIVAIERSGYEMTISTTGPDSAEVVQHEKYLMESHHGFIIRLNKN